MKKEIIDYYYRSFEDIAEFVQHEIYCEENDDVCIAALYEDAKIIIEDLIYIGYSIEEIDLHSYDYEYYDKEYYIIANKFGSLYCVRAFNESKDDYYKNLSDVTIFMEDCNSKLIKYSTSNEYYNAMFDDSDCDGDCENCECNENDDYELALSEDNDIPGFTISGNDENSSWSRSFYSSDKDLVKKMLELWS